MSLLFDIVKTAQGKPIDKVDCELKDIRVRTCEGCPHMNKDTRSCGTFLKGGTVNFAGQEMELCGCKIDDKAGYEDDHCPLYKW